MALVDHLLHQPVEKLVHLLGTHVLDALHHFLERFVVEQVALLESPLNGVLELFERVLVHLRERHVRIVEAAAQQEIGQRFEQILAVDAEVFTGIAGVANRFH